MHSSRPSGAYVFGLLQLASAAVGWTTHGMQHLRVARIHSHHSVQLSAAEDSMGQFVKHAELSPGSSPLGVICAGLDEDQLEAVAAAVEDMWTSPDGQLAHVPIVALSVLDFLPWVKLRDVLGKLSQRDGILPDRPARVRCPLVLFSGFSTVQTTATMRAVSALGLRGGHDEMRPMFAVAVPRSLGKRLGVLCEELESDHYATRGREPFGPPP